MQWSDAAKRRIAVEAPRDFCLIRRDSEIVRRQGWVQIITPSSSSTYLNEVVLSELPDQDADRVIRETINTYAQHKAPTKWCVGPWTSPDDFGERLLGHGFEGWAVRGMAVDPTTRIATGADVTVRRVELPELDRYIETSVAGWGLPDKEAHLEREGHGAALTQAPRRAELFLGFAGETPAGTAALVLHDGFAYLMGAQVLPGHRGRGLYRALIEARLDFLRARQIRLAVTQAREATSAPMLAHLGFETLFRSHCFARPFTGPVT